MCFLNKIGANYIRLNCYINKSSMSKVTRLLMKLFSIYFCCLKCFDDISTVAVRGVYKYIIRFSYSKLPREYFLKTKSLPIVEAEVSTVKANAGNGERSIKNFPKNSAAKCCASAAITIAKKIIFSEIALLQISTVKLFPFNFLLTYPKSRHVCILI